MQCNNNLFIQIIKFHGLFHNALRCRKLVPVEYWCPYGIYNMLLAYYSHHLTVELNS